MVYPALLLQRALYVSNAGGGVNFRTEFRDKASGFSRGDFQKHVERISDADIYAFQKCRNWDLGFMI